MQIDPLAIASEDSIRTSSRRSVDLATQALALDVLTREIDVEAMFGAFESCASNETSSGCP